MNDKLKFLSHFLLQKKVFIKIKIQLPWEKTAAERLSVKILLWLQRSKTKTCTEFEILVSSSKKFKNPHR